MGIDARQSAHRPSGNMDEVMRMRPSAMGASLFTPLNGTRKHETKKTNLNKTLTSMQEMAKSTPSVLAALPAFSFQGAHFWQTQNTFLKEFETFSTAWFKRRYEGTQTALDASKQLAEDTMGNPATAMGILADWQSHSMERLAEDAKDYMAMMTACAALTTANEVEAVEESGESAKRATKSAKSNPV